MSEHDNKTLTPWGLTSSEDLLPLLFQKLDELAQAQAAMKQQLEIHVATETTWQENVVEKLDAHLDEHKAASSVWRKGAVGAAFMLLGSLIIWAAAFIWTHRPPTP